MSVGSNNTATLPDDYVDWSKVGVVGSDGLVYVLGENKNINYSQKYSTSGGNTYDSDGDGLLDREDDKTATSGSANSDNLGDGMNSYIFRNYIYENDQGRLYGIGGGQYRGSSGSTWTRTESKSRATTASLSSLSSTSRTRAGQPIRKSTFTPKRL